MANLTLNEYQDKAMSTCMPESDNLFYMLANLVGEVGEFASKAGKHMRKGKLHITTTQRDEEGKILHTQIWNVSDEERHLMLSEIGDILWQTAGLAKVMGGYTRRSGRREPCKTCISPAAKYHCRRR